MLKYVGFHKRGEEKREKIGRNRGYGPQNGSLGPPMIRVHSHGL